MLKLPEVKFVVLIIATTVLEQTIFQGSSYSKVSSQWELVASDHHDFYIYLNVFFGSLPNNH